MLEFIEGTSPQPLAWSDEAAFEIGALLRQLHTLSAQWQSPPDAQWQTSFLRELPGRTSVIGHGDLGPWNILASDGRPVAFIDWDSAGPLEPLWELAHVTWQNAQLYDDDVSNVNHLPDLEGRSRQSKLILDGYGLGHDDRHDFVDRMIQLAIWSAREEAIEHQVHADTPSPSPDGYPILWAVTWRSRSAAWMLDHREILQKSISDG
ncbi:MAG TPA: phosphotransferase [Acidimicrobiales bacterium]|nr:phosphotransferase [Acidimicrobiales bacterium]